MKSQFRIMAVVVAALVSGTPYSVNAANDVVLSSTDGVRDTGGVVNFTGNISEDSCNVTPESENVDVDLGKWASSYFQSTGTETTKTPFDIKVENCPSSVTKVLVLFEGDHDATQSELLKTTGEAKGVAIQLLEADQKTRIPLGTLSQEYDVKAGADGANGSADLTFYANYYSTENAVEPGDANGVANFSMVYR